MLLNFITPAILADSYNMLYVDIALILMLVLLILLDKSLENRNLSEYGFRIPKLQNFNFIFYSFLLFFPFAFVSRLFTPNFDFWYSDYLSISNLVTFIPFILLLPLGVIIEELGMRALFQSRLSKMFGSRAAILVVTLNFIVLHTRVLLMAKFEYQLVMLFAWLAYSFLLSAVFEYTASIYPTLALHFLLDLVSSIQVLLHANSMQTYEVVLWSCWAALFVLNIKNIIEFLPRKIKTLIRAEIPSQYQLYLYVVSMPYPLFVILISTTSVAYILPVILLVPIIIYYLEKTRRSFIKLS